MSYLANIKNVPAVVALSTTAVELVPVSGGVGENVRHPNARAVTVFSDEAAIPIYLGYGTSAGTVKAILRLDPYETSPPLHVSEELRLWAWSASGTPNANVWQQLELPNRGA